MQSDEIINFAIDPSVKGWRGFLVRVIDSPSQIEKMKLNQNYWPIDKDYKDVTWWGPVHKTLGFQPWFNPVRNEYDSDAYQDKCYNILDGVCGK